MCVVLYWASFEKSNPFFGDAKTSLAICICFLRSIPLKASPYRGQTHGLADWSKLGQKPNFTSFGHRQSIDGNLKNILFVCGLIRTAVELSCLFVLVALNM